MCPHCNINPVQNTIISGDQLLCVSCTLAGFEPMAARFRALPPIYSPTANYRPDLFPNLERSR